MIRTVAVQGYRSLREFVLPLGQLSVITGANGSGKSSVYRSLRLLADVAQNAVVASLAREGGLPSTFWAGPETIAGAAQVSRLRPGVLQEGPDLIPAEDQQRKLAQSGRKQN